MKGGVGFYWKKWDIIPPPVTPPFFLGKKFFFGFSEKFSNFFSMKLTVKNFRIFFAMNSAVKNFSIA